MMLREVREDDDSRDIGDGKKEIELLQGTRLDGII